MPDVLSHPPVEDLAAFALGALDDEAVADHVSECPECQRAVAAAPGDTFTDILADAKTVVDAPAPGVDLPAELAEHPRYTPLRLLGVGGMGTVWLAEHTVMGRRVAVKVIRPEFTARPGAANRFRREVAAAARLHHPNIVTAFDAEQAGDAHFLAMEYVDGVGLDELLKEKGALPVAEACRYVADAATGLDHAHNAGLVHRDVKPGNLMRAADGTVKVLDFGLAMLVADDRADASLTGANMVVGTPDYIAPEQAEHPHAADGRADVYALGCTLYHLLAGAVPFPGSSVLKKLDAHRRDAPKPLSRFRTDIPRGLSEIVMKMMAKDPAARFASAAAVAHALRPYADGRPPRRERPRRFAVAAGFLCFALIAAGAVVYRIQTDTGELVIATQSDDVEIAVKQGGRLVTIIDTKTQKRVELKSGEYDLELKNADGLKLDIVKATLNRGKEVLATIERIPKPAVAMMPGMPGTMPGMGSPSGMMPGMPGPPRSDSAMPGGGPPGGMTPPGPMGVGGPMGASPGEGPAAHWPPAALPAKAGHMGRLPIQYADADSLRFSPDGRVIGVSSRGLIQLVETATGTVIAQRLFGSNPRAWTFTPDGTRVVVVAPAATANTYEFAEWRPDTGDVQSLGEPIRLATPVKAVFVQGSVRRLVLDTGGTYHVYDTKAKAMVKRVVVGGADREGMAPGMGGGGMTSSNIRSRAVSADGERVYTVVAERAQFPGGPPGGGIGTFKYALRLDHLIDEEVAFTKIDVQESFVRIFDVPRPVGSPRTAPAFGLLMTRDAGDLLVRLYDGLGRPAGGTVNVAKSAAVQAVAAAAPRAVVTAGGDASAFEALNLSGDSLRAPVGKIPNSDATAISDDGRVFAARTETGWNLYRLPDAPAVTAPPDRDKPAEKTAAPPSPYGLRILAGGTIVWKGQPIKREDVAKLLPPGTSAAPAIIISVDQDVPYEQVQQLLKELKGFPVEVRQGGEALPELAAPKAEVRLGENASLPAGSEGLIAELDALNARRPGRPGDDDGPDHAKKIEVLEKLVALAIKPAHAAARASWGRSLVHIYGDAAQKGDTGAFGRLQVWRATFAKEQPGGPLHAVAAYREMHAAYAIALAKAGGKPDEVGKAREERVAALCKFIEEFPAAAETPDVLWLLGSEYDRAGKETEAKGCFNLLVKNFPTAALAKKAAGALVRLGLVGKEFALTGPTLWGGAAFNVNTLKGKPVVVLYWASWAGTTPADFTKIRRVVLPVAESVELVSVNLDDDPKTAIEFLKANNMPGTQLHGPGGVKGETAAQYGIGVLPAMFLLDAAGKVVSRTVRPDTLEAELNKLVK